MSLSPLYTWTNATNMRRNSFGNAPHLSPGDALVGGRWGRPTNKGDMWGGRRDLVQGTLRPKRFLPGFARNFRNKSLCSRLAVLPPLQTSSAFWGPRHLRRESYDKECLCLPPMIPPTYHACRDWLGAESQRFS